MAHTAFKSPPSHTIPTEERPCTGYSHVPPLSVQGVVQEIILEARLMDKVSKPHFVKDPLYINGLKAHTLDMRTRIRVEDSKMCRMGHARGKNSEVLFTDFCPGSVIVFRCVRKKWRVGASYITGPLTSPPPPPLQSGVVPRGL